jgi:hypothetical protein
MRFQAAAGHSNLLDITGVVTARSDRFYLLGQDQGKERGLIRRRMDEMIQVPCK